MERSRAYYNDDVSKAFKSKYVTSYDFICSGEY